MLQGLLDFAQDIGIALSYLLPTLCYVSGGAAIISGVYGIYTRSAMQNGMLARGLVPEALIFGGATLLSFPAFLNAGTRTLGLQTMASMGPTTKMSFSTDALMQAAQSGPQALFQAVLTIFSVYFSSYGALIVFWAVVRQMGRVKGTNKSAFSTNLVICCFGILMMNADQVAPALAKELHLLQ